MKYVICRDDAFRLIGTPAWPRGGQSLGASRHVHALVFSESFTHATVVECLRRVYPGLVATSAGFVTITPDGLHCHGASESLGLSSDPLDAIELEDQIPRDSLTGSE